jgi:hypothetical protein
MLAALLAAIVLAAPAAAGEKELRAYEIATLGPAHAAEHARARAEARAAPQLGRPLPAPAPNAPADQVGRWSPATIDLPTFAINAVLLPTGKVAFWGRPPLIGGRVENRSEFWLWDPATGGLSRHDAPAIDLDGDGVPETPAPLFCSGQSLLADGQLFVAGGSLGYPDYLGGDTPNWRGLDRAYTFDPWSLTWQEQPRPRHGRWYPSQVQLPDGRIAILAGFDEHGQGVKNIEMEVFTPAAQRGGVGTMTHHLAGDRDTAFYPHLFTLPGGKVLMAGPDANDSAVLDPALLDGAGSAWTNLSPLHHSRVGGNAVLHPSGAVTLLGGWDYVPQGGDAVADTETLAGTQWTLNGGGIPRLNLGRSYGNVIQLPNGELVAIGGGAGNRLLEGSNWTDDDQRLKQVELLRPGVDTQWRLGPAQQKWRAYHSTALLLPDGRVLSAGDDYWHLGDQRRPEGGNPMDVGEIYSPPYLFDGDQPAVRPTIQDAPAQLPYGVGFGVAATRAARAVLVAPGATTHGADMNQRLIELQRIRTAAGGLDVRAPAGPDIAPPGYYMLFVLDADGTPSIARWVRMNAAAPAPPRLPEDSAPPARPPPAGTPPPVSRDTTAPRATVSLKRRGKRLRVRVRLSEPGRAAVDVRVKGRRVKRTLKYKRATTRSVKFTSRAKRVHVTVRARDTAGNRRTVRRSFSGAARRGRAGSRPAPARSPAARRTAAG